MTDLVRNERLKFLANWFSAIATAILTVGVFTPLAIMLYGIGEPPKNSDVLPFLPYVCFGAAIILHLMGHWLLHELDEGNDK